MKRLYVLLILIVGPLLLGVSAKETVESEHFIIQYEFISEQENAEIPSPLFPSVVSYPENAFSFSVSHSRIVAQSAVDISKEVDVIVSVDGDERVGFLVYAIQKNQLESSTNDTIPPTICNGTPDICTISNAQIWNNPQSVGFGYNLQGRFVPEDFISSEYFRPFPLGEPMRLAEHVFPISTEHHTLKMRIKTTPSQPSGAYHTTIEIIAIPQL